LGGPGANRARTSSSRSAADAPQRGTGDADSDAGVCDGEAARSGNGACERERGREGAASSDETGWATWYGAAFAGRKTASGERFDPRELTAAHRTLSLGTWVEVQRLDTGGRVRVRINDRGPWGDDRRIIDLSRKAAEMLDMVRAGVVSVRLRVVPGP